MSYSKSSPVKVGIFVLGAIIIVTATLFWAKGFFLTKNMREMKVYFGSVSGLNPGDPVTVSGVKKGKVVDFKLEADSVLIEFLLEEDVKVKEDYKIEIYSELMGGKMLNLSPGRGLKEINYNSYLVGINPTDMMSMMGSFKDMTGDIKDLIRNFNKSAIKLDSVLANLNDVIGDKNVKSDLKNTISNISVTSRNLSMLVSENKSTLKDLADKTGKTIDKVGNTVDNVNTIIDESKPDFQSTLKDIKLLTEKVNSLVGNLDKITEDIYNKKSAVGKFMYDDKFYDNLNNTLLEIEKLTKKIREEGVKIDLF